MHPFSQSSLTGYGIAIVTTLTVMSIELLLKPLFEGAPALLLFLLTVMVSAWYGGLGPGVLATVLGVFASRYFALEPLYSLRVTTPDEKLMRRDARQRVWAVSGSSPRPAMSWT
jgi:K+-sensing histidine kinase KdpD